MNSLLWKVLPRFPSGIASCLSNVLNSSDIEARLVPWRGLDTTCVVELIRLRSAVVRERHFGQNRDRLLARWALDGRYCEYL